MDDSRHKVAPSHLARNAYLYVRQSTLHQVLENTESTARQYALSDRAVALGWPIERVIVIDADLGQSGATADREGFKRLVTEVSLGHAGLVLGLEVSRLARNSTDWHRLLELCALSETLILDEDGLYDPAHFNDRLLLGLKGTMSEAELHILRARLRGGIISKAKRGELRSPVPIGFAYDPDSRVVLEPDVQVQEVVRHFFATFRRTGSARLTVREFRTQGILFPQRVTVTGQIVWQDLLYSRACQMLKNPRYAGAFFFGRTRQRRRPDGRMESRELPRDQWILVKDMHPGYISWEEYEENVRRLEENTRSFGGHRRWNPPREGPALLQGLVLCGRCGGRMTVRYHTHRRKRIASYWCGKNEIQRSLPLCQSIHGEALDDAVAELLVEAMTPLALEAALNVQQELVARAEEADGLRRKQVERARYEADVSQRRFLRVDPDNRLVADALEADWNAKLRTLTAAQEEYEKSHQAPDQAINGERRAEILALATDFPALWCDPSLPSLDRKRMVRFLIADVTLVKGDMLHADIRFTGGSTRHLDLPLPQTLGQLRATDATIVHEIDELLDTYTDGEIAELLNERGIRSRNNPTAPFTRNRVGRLRRTYGLKDRRTRLVEAGMLTPWDIAARCGVEVSTVHLWRRSGLLRAHPTNDKGDYLYEPCGELPTKYAHKRTDNGEGAFMQHKMTTSRPRNSCGAV
jgi:DNA invertase Pin-like site-specific DNA recombinase